MTKNKRGRPPAIYLIDACWRGNALRLYFGYSVEEIYGDDWDDIPYESNCGTVYPEYVECILDSLIPFNYTITDIADETSYGNSQYCRNDFKEGELPLLWIVDYGMDNRDDIKFYMGDNKDDVVKKLKLITSLISYKIKGGE
jgi:hypothetical protein